MKTSKPYSNIFRGIITAVLFLVAIGGVHAQTYWTGPNIVFTDSGNGATDILTANVIITRGTGGGGLYNAATESSATPGTSPAGTQWGQGTLAGYMSNPSSVTFSSCPMEAHGSPAQYDGKTFVVHLVTNDIYLQLTLNAWGGQFGIGSKSFSYTRSTPALAAPTISITNPLSNAVFAAPASVSIAANAAVSGGAVTNVQFFTNNVSAGSVTTAPFTLTANNLAAGAYNLTAAATAGGISTTSAAVNISVVTSVTVGLSNVTVLAGTNFQFSYSANVGLDYIVQRTTNLSANWTTLSTSLAASNPVVFVDVNASNSPEFYRVGRLPNP